MNVATSFPDDDGTESLDSVLVEFTDVHIDFTPQPIRDAVLQHLPSWLREAAEKRRLAAPKAGDAAALARCLLDQARVLAAAQRFAEAVPKVTEAEGLYRELGNHYGLADGYHVAAEVHRGLGEIDKALDYLRKEEEIRRRLAA
jgi:tetratricopeptide (TPR) repeat protein